MQTPPNLKPDLPQQLAATDALLHFLKTHGFQTNPDLLACRSALEQGGVPSALKHAYGIKIFGMGSITDNYPTPIEPFETQQYCQIVFESLVRNWASLIVRCDPKFNAALKGRTTGFGEFF